MASVTLSPVVVDGSVKSLLNLLVDYRQPHFVAARAGLTESRVKKAFRGVCRDQGFYTIEELRAWWKQERRRIN